MKTHESSKKNNENYKQQFKLAKKFVNNLKRETDIYTIAHFDLPKSTQKMKINPEKEISEMLLHNKICRIIIKKNDGVVIKELGDAVLATFKNSGVACDCAIKIMRNLKINGNGMETKVTFVTGTIWKIKTDDKIDIYGVPVNLCTRLSKYASVNSILIESDRYYPIRDWLQKDKKIKYSHLKPKLVDDFGSMKLTKIKTL